MHDPHPRASSRASLSKRHLLRGLSWLAGLAWLSCVCAYLGSFLRIAPLGEIVGLVVFGTVVLLAVFCQVEDEPACEEKKAPKTSSLKQQILMASAYFGLFHLFLAMMAWFLLTKDPFYFLIWSLSGGALSFFAGASLALDDWRLRLSQPAKARVVVPAGSLSSHVEIEGGSMSLLFGDRGQLSLDGSSLVMQDPLQGR